MLTWEIELNKFFRTQSVPLSRRDYNAYDYRTETLGRERNYRSFERIYYYCVYSEDIKDPLVTIFKRIKQKMIATEIPVHQYSFFLINGMNNELERIVDNGEQKFSTRPYGLVLPKLQRVFSNEISTLTQYEWNEVKPQNVRKVDFGNSMIVLITGGEDLILSSQVKTKLKPHLKRCVSFTYKNGSISFDQLSLGE